jgi:hypothetical protein
MDPNKRFNYFYHVFDAYEINVMLQTFLDPILNDYNKDNSTYNRNPISYEFKLNAIQPPLQ